MGYDRIQAALKAKGYGNLGSSGPNEDGVDGDWGPRSISELRRFQRENGLSASGIPDIKTLSALGLNPTPPIAKQNIIPQSWMPPSKMKAIVVHWTAGTHIASPFDKKHYHLLIESDGTIIRGTPPISSNSLTGLKSDYAAHALNFNSGAIGVSLCCMGDNQNPSRVKEKPFYAGPYAMSQVQWDSLPPVLAILCRRYGIPVSPTTVLSHAEIEPTLGIEQRGKWDITRLAFDTDVKGHKACGDIFRRKAADLIASGSY